MNRKYEICDMLIPESPTYPEPKFRELIPSIRNNMLRQPYFLPGYGGHKPGWIQAAGHRSSKWSHGVAYRAPLHKISKPIFAEYEDYSKNKEYPIHKLRQYLQRRQLCAQTRVTYDYIPQFYTGYIQGFGPKFGLRNTILKTECVVKQKRNLDKLEIDCLQNVENNIIQLKQIRRLQSSMPFVNSVSTPLLPKKNLESVKFQRDKCHEESYPTFLNEMETYKHYVAGYTGRRPGEKVYGLIDFNYYNKKNTHASETRYEAFFIEGTLKHIPKKKGNRFSTDHLQSRPRMEFRWQVACSNNKVIFEQQRALLSSRAGLKEDLKKRGFLEMNTYKKK